MILASDVHLKIFADVYEKTVVVSACLIFKKTCRIFRV